MAKATPARRAALRVLGQVRQRDAYAREVLRASPAVGALEPRDRAFAGRLVLGVTAARGTLDRLLDGHVRKPGSLEPRVRDAMRIAAFELLYLETPERAAVSQGVELVRSVSPRAVNLANAVLRKVAEDRYSLKRTRLALNRVAATGEEPVDGRSLAAMASSVGAMPQWLAARVAEERGPAALATVALGELEPAPLWVAGDKERLAEAGCEPVPVAVPGAFLVERPGALAASGLVGDGDVVVSDLAAQTVALMAVPENGGSLLEVGSGRGTKTLLVQRDLARLGWSARHVAVEVSESKARVARERLDKTAAQVEVLVRDGRELGGLGRFTTVLVDAPCSGTGTMRRHPETVWSLQPEDVAASNPDGLPALQLALLEAAAPCVAPGGTLVYATCSVLKAENEDVVATFLASDEGSGFSVAPAVEAPAVQGDAVAWVTDHQTEQGALRTLPQAAGCDGHYCVRLVREP